MAFFSQTPRARRRSLAGACSLGFLLIFFSTLSVIINSPQAYALVSAPLHLKGVPAKPHKLSPKAGSASLTQRSTLSAPGNQKPGTPQTITHGLQQVPMKAGSVGLAVTTEARFLGSDGRLEIDVPPGAITAQDLTSAGGIIRLHVTQIAPASGSNDGGDISLGMYLIQLVDAHGRLLTHGLHAAITMLYHIHPNELSLGLDHVSVLFNGTLPDTAVSMPGAVKPALGKSLVSTLGTPESEVSVLNLKTQTLTVSPRISTPSTSLAWNSDAPLASFGKPDPFSTDLSSGGLTDSETISVPPGPGGLTPPINLAYSSESVNEQHSYASAPGWVGEGWNLSLGEISWNQHNVVAGCTPQPSCGTNWQNQWSLNDAYGTSSELIPPNVTASTYYDASSNTACQLTNPSVACPILWHTATESHEKIYAYVGSLTIPSESINPVCWRVWLPDGFMEEFGCTSDSLQYFYVPGGHAEVNGWFLDMITDPQGNQVHITYQRDMENWKDPTTGTTYSYPRDVELSTVQYDSPGCLNAQTMCTGSSWAPQMQVVFNASHGPSILTGTAPSGCNTGTNLRCDDPLDLSSSGGTAAPLIQNTFVLNSLQVQARTTGTGGWNTLNTYSLGYEQSGPTTITDPASGLQASVAGMLDLTRFQEWGSTGATALMYSGKDTSTTTSHAYMKVFDVSSQNLVVGANTTLSYWIYPQSSTANGNVSGSNSTCVAIDMVFTDGTDLRDSGAVDQNGNQLHPAHQCGHLTLDQWNYVTSNIGAKVSGKTINRIDMGYDQPANTGGYRGYIDDISLTNPGSSTPLFATNLESGSPQPTWTNTVDTTAPGGNLVNIGGFSGSLTAPELGTRQETAHTDSSALPLVQFSYTSSGLTNYYVDSFFKPNPSTNCGPSWNTGHGSGCLLWEQSYANNDRYMSSTSNGQGLSQSFSWAPAHNNSHGVNGGGSNNANPLYCNGKQTSYPCNETDDSGWSHVVLSSESVTTTRLTQAGQGGAQTNTPITTTTNYNYLLTYPLPAQECSDCVAGMYWGDQNNNNYLNYYDGTFMGFAQTTVNKPDGGVEVHKFYAGEGWGIYDPSEVTCFTTAPCHTDPWWDLANAAHGHEYETLDYDANGTTLLKEVDATYTATCPPTGVSGTPHNGSITWDGKLISDLDHNNPVAVCDVQMTQQVNKTYDGASNPVTTTTSWTYDSYGRTTRQTVTANSGTPGTVVTNTSYVWKDAVTATKTSASGTYLISTVAFSDVEDGSGNRLSCSYTSYDGPSYLTGQTSSLTDGFATTHTTYSNCGNASNGYTPSGPSTTTVKYDTYGNVVGTDDADANAGISGHTGCMLSSTAYTGCTTYENTFDVFSTSTSNALNQTSTTSYANTSASFGYGTWPISTTDPNSQSTSYTYDGLGRVTGEVDPGETTGDVTTQWVYTNWCSGTSAQAPCEEVDQVSRLNSTTTVTTRAFYDGLGRLVETRSPGPVGQDVVTYVSFDSAGRPIFKSNPYFVTAYTGTPGSAAYSIPDSTQPGASTNYYPTTPNLRTTSVTDPNSFTTTTTTASVICGVAGTSDTGCYVQTMVVDANGHESATLTNGLGEKAYAQTYTGISGSYALSATTAYTYDAAGNVLSTVSPDGSTATSTYDDLGQLSSQSNLDQGTTTYTYDPDGNPVEEVDARGSSGTIYAAYDGLNRPLWRNSTNSASGAWITYTYDSTANGNDGVGNLTGESFTGSGSLSGSYAYTYDARGQQVGDTITVNGTSYPMQVAFNDNTQVTSETYPDGEVVTNGYDNNGWLIGLTTQVGSTVTTLASNLTYTGLAGAAGKITTMDFGNGDISNTSYDTGLRLTSTSLTQASNNTLLYQTQPSYDAANNVVSVQTSIMGATDNQQFCYDSLNRLTWAGSTGTPPCASLSPGTLTAAQYQQSTTYTIDGGLSSGSAGSYSYGNSSQPHTLTATSSGYSAAYDAAGNETCRATSSATTCSGSSPTGQTLTYDPEERLSTWQNAPVSPTETENYLYDGEGNRVATLSTINGTTTLTAFLGSAEEIQTTGGSSQTTAYYTVAGTRIAASVNGTLDYFGYDVLGSQVVVLNNSSALVASQLYGPHGESRYNAGVLPTSIGFTGQQADSVTGLDYYVARYYDPVVGVFLSPDNVQGNDQGMDPYAYVSGNPETLTDPTGNCGFGSWGDVGSCFTQAAQAVGTDIGTGIGDSGSDIGEIFGGIGVAIAGAARAIGGILADNVPAIGGIGIFVMIGLSLTHTTSLGCGCVASSTATARSIADGMTKPRAWDTQEQKDIAQDLARETDAARKKAVAAYSKAKTKNPNKNPGKANGAEGLLMIFVGGKVIDYPPFFALGYPDGPHAEALIVAWAERTLSGFKGSLQGAVINLLIFSQTPVCPDCQSAMTSGNWLNRLYAATGLPGGMADVNLDIWQTSPDPGNISGVESVCTGTTNGINTSGNCP